MTINYYLKNPKSSKSVLFISFYYQKKRYKFYTSFSISPKIWSKKKQQVFEKQDIELINPKLMTLKNSVINALSVKDDYSEQQVKTIVNNIINNKEVNIIKYIAVVNEHPISDPHTGQNIEGYGYQTIEKIEDYDSNKFEQKDETTILQAFSYFIENTPKLSKGTLKQYSNTKTKLIESGIENITLSDLKVKDINTLINFLLSKEQGNETINKHLKNIKRVLRTINKNHPALDFERMEMKGKKVFFVLLPDELEKVKKCKPLTDSHKKIKDLFIFQCLTGLSISDFQLIEKSNFDLKGKILTIERKKSETPCNIYLEDEAIKILKRYDFNLMTFSDQHYNDEIKKIIGYSTNLNYDVTIKRKSGSKILSTTKPANEWVSSHTARRIFITHSLNNNVPISTIAAQTGQNLTTVEKYNHTSKLMVQKFYKNRDKDE